jgi:ABC-type phosphate transport system substrate-binding protein
VKEEGKAMLWKSLLLTVSVIVCLVSNGWTQDSNHIAIIINPTNPTDNLSGQELRQIFLAEQQRWPNGDVIKVIMRSPGQPERATVLQHVYEMQERDFSRYFLQAVFTGTVQAVPKRFATAAGVCQFVASVPGAIGYVRSSDVDGSVKIVRLDKRLPGEPGYGLVLP